MGTTFEDVKVFMDMFELDDVVVYNRYGVPLQFERIKEKNNEHIFN